MHAQADSEDMSKIWDHIPEKVFSPTYPLVKTCQTYPNFKFPEKRMLDPQEGGRLDAKRHYVILAKALDGIWPVGHACAVLC